MHYLNNLLQKEMRAKTKQPMLIVDTLKLHALLQLDNLKRMVCWVSFITNINYEAPDSMKSFYDMTMAC